MGKLENLASQWVADGLYSSLDEAEAAIGKVLSEHASARRYRAELEGDIRDAVDELDRGEGTVYASMDEAFADILGEDWVEKKA